MIRGISLRQLALLLLGPMLAEGINTVIITWMLVQASLSMGLEPREVMFINAAGSAGYGISAYIAGRWVTARVAPRLLVGAICGLGIGGLLAFSVHHFAAFIVASVILGVCTGHYYVPFQSNMSHVRPFRTLAYSVAFYNMAWGVGVTLGPLAGGGLRGSPVWMLLALVGLMIALHTVIALLAALAPPPAREEAGAADFASTPRHRRLGMICMFAAAVVTRGVYAPLFPDLGKHHHWTDLQIGLGLMLLFIPVPLLALPLARMRRVLHQPGIMLGAMGVGLAGLAGMPMTGSWPVALACAAAIGVMESIVVFNVIYYTNSDPATRSRSVGAFETLIGASNIIGPICLGLLAWDNAGSWRPYTFGCALLAAAIAYVAGDLLRNGPLRETGNVPTANSVAGD